MKKEKLICLNDGKVYGSQGEVAKALGVSKQAVSMHLSGKTLAVGGKSFERLSEYKKGDKPRKRKTKRVVCLNDGMTFDSVREACEHYGHPNHIDTLYQHLTGDLPTAFGLTFQYERDYMKNPKAPVVAERKTRRHLKGEFLIVCLDNMRSFRSYRDAAAFFDDMRVQDVRRALASGRPIKGRSFAYFVKEKKRL